MGGGGGNEWLVKENSENFSCLCISLSCWRIMTCDMETWS